MSMTTTAPVTTPPGTDQEVEDIGLLHPRTANEQKIIALVKSFYDFQKTRIQMGNRVFAAMNPDIIVPAADLRTAKDAEDPEDETDKKDDEQQKAADSFIARAHKEYTLVTARYIKAGQEKKKGEDAAKNSDSDDIPSAIRTARLTKAIKASTDSDHLEIIKTELDYRLMRSYDMTKRAENEALVALTEEVKRHPLWDSFFANVPGCGPTTAAVCIASINIHKARHVSSLWKYAGVDVLPNGEGRSKRHFSMVEYTDKDGNVSTRKSLGYNPFLKTKLVGVFGSSILRCPTAHEKGYGKVYYDYKARLQERPDLKTTPFGASTKFAGTVTEIVSFGAKVKKGDILAAVLREDGTIHNIKAKVDGIVTFIFAEVGEEVAEKTMLVRYEIAAEPKARIHRMATRYAVKMFLRDLWIAWRGLEGYDTSMPDYAVAFLGRKPHGYNEANDPATVATAG